MINAKYEALFAAWASPPPESEQTRCENSIRAIRKAIDDNDALVKRSVKVFVQGSYRNRVNISADSDVDIGVVCNDVFLTQYPENYSDGDFGNISSDYTFSKFKNELEEALVSKFGRNAVQRGNKAFQIKENTYRLNADVVPLFEFRQYWTNATYRAGVALFPDDGGRRIENYPERIFEDWPATPLHYENGVSKNTLTGRSFKGVVRILKRLLATMREDGFASADSVPGYLLECLAYNCSNPKFAANNWCARTDAVVDQIWRSTYSIDACKSWVEVDGIKYLFHSTQPWTRDGAFTFFCDLREYLDIS